jgi:hypothetical protein
VHRRIGLAHLGEHLFGRHATVHQPHPARFAVLPFDALKKPAQRRLVRGIAGQNLVGKRQAFRRHHQRDDDLHAIRPMIARIAKAALVAFRKRRICLEVGARQIGYNQVIIKLSTVVADNCV